MSQGGRLRFRHDAGRGTPRVLGALLCALSLFGCGSDDSNNDGAGYYDPDYELGGQTGSLIPGCGVAPLSAAGSSVPAGEALAVLYTRDCPESDALSRVALGGAGDEIIRLQLIPLGDGAYLVRSEQSLPAGDYELSNDEIESGVRVDAEAPGLPMSLGPLRFLASDVACSEQLRFELELDDAMLAYAPLSRFMLRMDGGSEQLWIDYGALPIETNAEGSRGVLELPRCSLGACLEGGPHYLELSATIAGETIAPDPIGLDFSVNCPTAPAASTADFVSSRDPGCSLGAAERPASAIAQLVCAVQLLWLALRRRSKQRARSTAL